VLLQSAPQFSLDAEMDVTAVDELAVGPLREADGWSSS
jgi:hypothetical protein